MPDLYSVLESAISIRMKYLMLIKCQNHNLHRHIIKNRLYSLVMLKLFQHLPRFRKKLTVTEVLLISRDRPLSQSRIEICHLPPANKKTEAFSRPRLTCLFHLCCFDSVLTCSRFYSISHNRIRCSISVNISIGIGTITIIICRMRICAIFTVFNNTA